MKLITSLAIITLLSNAYAQNHVVSQVSSSLDDAEEDLGDGSLDITSSDLELGIEDNIWPLSDDVQEVGIRFQNLNIPHGAIIDSAYIQFTCDETNSDPSTVEIFGEDINNAQGFFELDFNITFRTKTAQSVTWNIDSWDHEDEAGQKQRTPDLTQIVQHIVNRPGWVANNCMNFLITGSGTRAAHSRDGDASLAPVLHVYYSAVTGIDAVASDNLQVYPNPSNGSLKISSTHNCNYQVLSISGQLLESGVVLNQSLDLNQENGIYFLHLQFEDGSSATKKIIIKL